MSARSIVPFSRQLSLFSDVLSSVYYARQFANAYISSIYLIVTVQFRTVLRVSVYVPIFGNIRSYFGRSPIDVGAKLSRAYHRPTNYFEFFFNKLSTFRESNVVLTETLVYFNNSPMREARIYIYTLFPKRIKRDHLLIIPKDRPKYTRGNLFFS